MKLFDLLYIEVFTAIRNTLGISEADMTLEIPPEMKLGDFAFPTFKLAKTLRKAPPIISKELSEKLLTDSKLTSRYDIVSAGPYVNFTIKKDFLLKEVLGSLLLSGDSLSHKENKNSPKVILEFSSPNVAKAFNIYHLRSTMIGNSLYRIFKARGYEPIAINHLGDWGTQFGSITLAYDKWGDDSELSKRGIEYLVELYVRINKEMELDSTLKDTAREYFNRLEKGDSKIHGLWKKFVDLSMTEFNRMYKRLGVHFDHFWGESFYSPYLKNLEETINKKNLLVESEGAMVVKLEDYGMPPCIVKKQDGSSIYATRDLAAAIYRQEKFNFEKMIYIVGGEQKLHFAQVFKVLELMGYTWAKNCTHIDFGLYKFQNDDGSSSKMSTRRGKFVTLEAVLDEAVNRAQVVMTEKAKESGSTLTENEIADAAEIIGTGAIIYNDLSTDRNHDVVFNLERIVSFDGETGPYIQYAHTRCLSIFRNAPKNLNTSDLNGLHTAALTKLNETEELELIRVLAKLPFILDLVLKDYRPSILSNYLIDITKAFNVFYRNHKVLVEDTEVAKARLSLVLATQRVLNKGLYFLGMKTPERM